MKSLKFESPFLVNRKTLAVILCLMVMAGSVGYVVAQSGFTSPDYYLYSANKGCQVLIETDGLGYYRACSGVDGNVVSEGASLSDVMDDVVVYVNTGGGYGLIHFGKGLFVSDGAFEFNDRVVIEGEGSGTTQVEFDGAINGFVFHALEAESIVNPIIRDIEIKDDGTNGLRGVYCYRDGSSEVTHMSFTNVYVTGFEYGVYVNTPFRGTFVNCVTENQHGVSIGMEFNGGIVAVYNQWFENLEKGVVLRGSASGTFVECKYSNVDSHIYKISSMGYNPSVWEIGTEYGTFNCGEAVDVSNDDWIQYNSTSTGVQVGVVCGVYRNPVISVSHATLGVFAVIKAHNDTCFQVGMWYDNSGTVASYTSATGANVSWSIDLGRNTVADE